MLTVNRLESDDVFVEYKLVLSVEAEAVEEDMKEAGIDCEEEEDDVGPVLPVRREKAA